MTQQWRALQAAAGFAAHSLTAETEGSQPAAPSEVGDRRRLDLALDGGQVEGHEAPITLLGSFFTSLQNTVTSVAQALTGAPTAAAPIPGHIQGATLLRSAPAFPSSYGVHLYGPAQSPPVHTQDDLFGSAVDSPSSSLLDEAVAAIFEIAETAQSSPGDEDLSDDRLADRVVPLGQRAVKHLGTLSGLLAEAGVDLRLSWEPGTDRARTCTLDRHGAARLKLLSDRVDFGETTAEIIEGLLVEASMRRGSVEIQTRTGRLIAARTAEEVTMRLGDDLLGKPVEATATVTTVRYTAGRERQVYTVTDLRPAESRSD
ncbi:hypothetical protein ACFRMQ_38805 [Kitasatospora sp. NPDC056783]|uniref:hypothetical protein n=1 Tax=Kitasatospora sp. NPDC056783 TaxID=3345943 RepID=UPI0036B82B77